MNLLAADAVLIQDCTITVQVATVFLAFNVTEGCGERHGDGLEPMLTEGHTMTLCSEYITVNLTLKIVFAIIRLIERCGFQASDYAIVYCLLGLQLLGYINS